MFSICSWVRRVLKRWGWSRKSVQYWSPNKFSSANIRHYVRHVVWILQWVLANSLRGLHYADAASFEDKALQVNHGYAERGRRIQLQGPQRHDRHSWTCFVMTDLRNRNRGFVVSSIKDGSNTATDFFRFVIWAVGTSVLRPGDVLVVDNASIHTARSMLRPLLVILRFFAVRLIFLPTYSPELNPVELIWAQVKNHLRAHRRDGVPFLAELLRAFGCVTADSVVNYYLHCLVDFRCARDV